MQKGKPFLRYALAACLLLTAFPCNLSSAEYVSEYKLKAALIYNFLKFTEWPENRKTINLCIIGNDPFNGELKPIEKRKIGDKSIKILYKDYPDTKICSAVFVSQYETAFIMPVITSISNSPVLTISDSEDFVRIGGMVSLIKSGAKIEFDINKTAITRANIKISSKMLELARNANE